MRNIIPEEFYSKDKDYIVVPALKRFVKNNNIKTSETRDSLMKSISDFALLSDENKKSVMSWIDSVLIEGIKDVHINFFDMEFLNESVTNNDMIAHTLFRFLDNGTHRHLCDKYTPELKLFRFEIIDDSIKGKIIKLYLGKLLCYYDKKTNRLSAIPFPIFVEIFVDSGMVVGRAKSKASLYSYNEDMVLDATEPTSSDREIKNALDCVLSWFSLSIIKDASLSDTLKNKLFLLLNENTQTPKEISVEIIDKSNEIDAISDNILSVANASSIYKNDIRSDVINMIEKYMAISKPDKSIFTQSREAYPLKLNATDEEESKVEQVSAYEESLQSKAIFYDNKKMLQKTKSCNECTFCFYRLNSIYFNKTFKVKISINRFGAILKFTEYTIEEDIIHVLYSLIDADIDAE